MQKQLVRGTARSRTTATFGDAWGASAFRWPARAGGQRFLHISPSGPGESACNILQVGYHSATGTLAWATGPVKQKGAGVQAGDSFCRVALAKRGDSGAEVMRSLRGDHVLSESIGRVLRTAQLEEVSQCTLDLRPALQRLCGPGEAGRPAQRVSGLSASGMGDTRHLREGAQPCSPGPQGSRCEYTFVSEAFV